tara:strand:+ start:13 stop:618 length:606 start_codon:yes stop_codon:yes gene_type:complete
MPTLEVFDDIIDKSLQEKIKSTLFTDNFPWFFVDDVTTDTINSQSRPAFFHKFYDNFENNSEYAWITEKIISSVIDKFKLKITQIIQSRTFLQLPLNGIEGLVDNAHIDSSRSHLVVLYYVMDSDGDTIIYDKKWERGIQDLNSEETKKMIIKKRVTPKQGRVVVFDGKYWHTAEQPTHNKSSKRCVINNNITYEGINANV